MAFETDSYPFGYPTPPSSSSDTRWWWSRPIATMPADADRRPTSKEKAAYFSPLWGGLLTAVAMFLYFLFTDKADPHAKFSIQSIAISPFAATYHFDFLVRNPSSRYSIYYDDRDASVRFGHTNVDVFNITRKRNYRDHTAFSLDFVAGEVINGTDVALHIKLRGMHERYIDYNEAGYFDITCHIRSKENIEKINCHSCDCKRVVDLINGKLHKWIREVTGGLEGLGGNKADNCRRQASTTVSSSAVNTAGELTPACCCGCYTGLTFVFLYYLLMFSGKEFLGNPGCYLELFASSVTVSNANANANISTADWRVGLVARSPVTRCKISLHTSKSRLLRGDHEVVSGSAPWLDGSGQLFTSDNTYEPITSVDFKGVEMPGVLVGDLVRGYKVEIAVAVKAGRGHIFLIVLCGDLPVKLTADPKGNVIGSLLGNMKRCEYVYSEIT
ncbi:hypothetical protein Bca4012_011545 [Brassica carinata]